MPEGLSSISLSVVVHPSSVIQSHSSAIVLRLATLTLFDGAISLTYNIFENRCLFVRPYIMGTEARKGQRMAFRRHFLLPVLSLLLRPLFAELVVPPPLQGLVPIPAIFCTFTPCRTLLPSPPPLPTTPALPPPVAEVEGFPLELFFPQAVIAADRTQPIAQQQIAPLQPQAVAPTPVPSPLPSRVPPDAAAQPPAVIQSALPPPNLPPARPIVFDFVPAPETLVPPAPPALSMPYYQPVISPLPPPAALPAPIPVTAPVPMPPPSSATEVPLLAPSPQLRQLLQDFFFGSPQAETLPTELVSPPAAPTPPLLPAPPHLLPSPALFPTTIDMVNAIAAAPPAIGPIPAPLPLRYLSPSIPPPPTPLAPIYGPYKKFSSERGKRNGTKKHDE
uniref:Uncharacterized protein n=1 Tax=Globodera rostochiensis TaxID=31243 RepID=A0A914HTJ3_GLORO